MTKKGTFPSQDGMVLQIIFFLLQYPTHLITGSLSEQQYILNCGVNSLFGKARGSDEMSYTQCGNSTKLLQSIRAQG